MCIYVCHIYIYDHTHISVSVATSIQEERGPELRHPRVPSGRLTGAPHSCRRGKNRPESQGSPPGLAGCVVPCSLLSAAALSLEPQLTQPGLGTRQFSLKTRLLYSRLSSVYVSVTYAHVCHLSVCVCGSLSVRLSTAFLEMPSTVPAPSAAERHSHTVRWRVPRGLCNYSSSTHFVQSSQKGLLNISPTCQSAILRLFRNVCLQNSLYSSFRHCFPGLPLCKGVWWLRSN